jgi:hypothetical protein
VYSAVFIERIIEANTRDWQTSGVCLDNALKWVNKGTYNINTRELNDCFIMTRNM